jgi:hypothetical protein
MRPTDFLDKQSQRRNFLTNCVPTLGCTPYLLMYQKLIDRILLVWISCTATLCTRFRTRRSLHLSVLHELLSTCGVHLRRRSAMARPCSVRGRAVARRANVVQSKHSYFGGALRLRGDRGAVVGRVGQFGDLSPAERPYIVWSY